MEDKDGIQRSLRTPTRDRSRSRWSCNSRLREREPSLNQRQKRPRLFEMDLRATRDTEQRCSRSELRLPHVQASRRDHRSRSRSISPAARGLRHRESWSRIKPSAARASRPQEIWRRSTPSAARSSRTRESRSRSRPSAAKGSRPRESWSRSRLQEAKAPREPAPAGVGQRHSNRSCSPTFSSRDVIQIIQSIKDILPSQPSSQSTHVINRGIDHRNIIPEFNPSEKNQRVDVWIKKVNECAEVYGWDEKTLVHFAMQKLAGLAKTWYESLNSILYSWEEWQIKLSNAFPSEQNFGQLLEDMLKRKSRPNELIENYYYEKIVLLNQCEIYGRKAVDCVIHGISDRTIRSSALALRCEEPDQLLKFLLSNNKELQQPPVRDRNTFIVEDRQGGNRANLKTISSLYCYNCKEKGHPFSRCIKPLLKCTHCNKIGHKSEICRNIQDKGSGKSDLSAKTMRISSSNICNKFIKKVFINENDVCFEAFVDLGSEVTLIRQSDFDKLGVCHDATLSTMKGFGNNIVKSMGSVELNLSIDGVSATVSCRVVDDRFLEKSMLIGQTYTEQPHVIVYKDANKLQFLDIGAEVPCPDLHKVDQHMERVRVFNQCVLFGTASVKASTSTVFTGSVLLDTKIVGKPNSQYFVCGGVYQVNNGLLFVVVIPCEASCLLQSNSVFSRAERVESVYRLADVQLVQNPVGDEILSSEPFDQNQVQLGKAVSDIDRAKLIDILRRNQGCFANDLAGLGCTSVTEMKIELNSQRPVVYRPYRLSHHEREKVRAMVDDMLQAGIIRESVSSYASPIILVRKKDGNMRLCVDYRQLNSITVKERYPMPVIEDEISRLSGQAWFITLDLMSGYYQVPIAKDSKHLTAFVTPDGQYEYNRMPFGLANAPAVFQRMMHHVLGPARFDKATVYIDDVLIFGKTAAECLDRFEEILGLIKKANLKLNLSKCSFLQNEINYLGYEISAAGMRPGKTKIQSVVNFPRPENVHGVRQFLGLVSYFRKFIQGFAQYAYPLTKLLKKDTAYEWTNFQEEAFKTLKAKLTDRPVLSIYDPSAETELHADASKLGVGGILLQRSQGSSGSFHPVAYYSRQTTPEEKNFHSYELETLAVICSLKKFRVYLLGKPFKVVSDCSALRSTFVKRDLIPRIARWWLALQEFDCCMEYRAGTKMGHVDALSRNPVIDPDNWSSEKCPNVMIINNEDWLLTLQLGDPELRRIRDIISSDLDPQGLDYIKQNYVIKDNKLFRIVGEDCVRWVVPKGARWQLCKMNHDDIGHVGFEKVLERIKKNYWFSKMKRFVKKYVGACIDCAYSKKTLNTREGLLHPIEKVAIPFHTLHIDHLGPFVKSKGGYTHILNVVDGFTKFVFIKPVRSTNTQNVIRVLQDIFDTFRRPTRLISDRGSCFTSHAFKKFCRDKNIKHVLNAVASPRSNGQVERYNRTILDSLIAQNLRDNEKSWDNKLGTIQWGLNNTIQKTIGKTPAEVLFGTGMNSEVNPGLNELTDSDRLPVLSELSSIRDQVKLRIDKAQAAQKQYYDQGRRPARRYNKGDLVKITKVAFHNDGRSTKLLPSYEGPFRVIKVLGNDRYKVGPISGFEGTRKRKKTTVAADRMQPWIHVASLEIDDDNEIDARGDASDDNN